MSVWQETQMRMVTKGRLGMDSIEDLEDALDIQMPTADHLFVEDCRRLTGPGLLWGHAGAVLQLSFDDINPDQIVDLWHKNARVVLDAIGWQSQQITERQFDGGFNLAISAPMDQLYSAIFVVQTAWHFCAAKLLSAEAGNLEDMVHDLKSAMAREANPALLEILTASLNKSIEALCDDDEVSLGHGTGSRTWPVNQLPRAQDVAWDSLHNIPIALITGTNGKTTTTRLCAAIARAAGKISGLTSTDFVRVGDKILERGDFSGPGGARLLLRDPRLQMAYLEVARGGILRRGLPTRQARAAVVTNVAADHLGQYGVNTVQELARAKFAVHRALARDGVLVLNADDPYVRREASRTQATICWFSLEKNTPQITEALSNNNPCAWVEDHQIVYFDGQQSRPIILVKDIPITLAGAAKYNTLNALAAVCVSRAMGLDDSAIRTGLSGFKSDPTDNPGRFNEFTHNDARIFVDFAHNPHSITAVAEAINAIPAQRRFVLLSHAGDRSDQDIRDATQSALKLNPDFVVAAELPEYLRGRETGEISQLIADTCLAYGLKKEQILAASSPLEGVKEIIKMLQSQDVALLLVLSQRDQVFELLNSWQQQ